MLRFNILKMGLVPQRRHIFHFPKVHPLKIQPSHNKKFLEQYRPFQNSRKYIHDVIDTDTEDSPESIYLWSTDKLYENTRQLLYPNSLDEIILRLNECNSPSEVLEVITENTNKLNHTHICQAVLVIRDIIKILCSSTSVQTEYMKDSDVMKILNIVARYVIDLSADEAACISMFFSRMGVKLNNEVLQALLGRCEELIEKLGDEFPLQALSRYAIAINCHEGLWTAYSSIPVLPVVLSKLHRCSKAEDLELITVCLSNIHYLVSESVMKAYSTKVRELLDSNIIVSDHISVILKAAYFLNKPQWELSYSNVVKELLLKLKNKVKDLEPRDLIVVNKIFNIQLEPASLMTEIQSSASKLLSEGFDESNSKLYITSINLVLCAIGYSPPHRRRLFENLVLRSLHNNNFKFSIHKLYKILRYLKSSNTNLYDLFWTRALRLLEDTEDKDVIKLLQYCQRYMYFNNNLGGTYRHYDYEKQMIQWLVEVIESKSNGLVPWHFARMAGFIIAYFKKSKDSDKLPDIIINKMQDLSPQFSELDCLHISRGLQIAAVLQYRNQISKALATQLVTVNQILDCCAYRQIKNENLDILRINTIMRAYTNRSRYTETELFQQIARRYERKHAKLTSRSIRATSFIMQAANHTFPETVEQMTSYIIEKKDELLGETAERILFSCFNLGFRPKNADQYLAATDEIIFRDRETMSGVALTQAALALCYYHGLSNNMINYIFSVNFLERLDDEMSHCYSKATYPMRVRHMLMQLNRAVCLDYPEADIPWFHKKYCEDIIAQAYTEASQFHEDVHHTLKSLIGEDKIVQVGTYSPYSYKIDFLLNTGEEAHSENQRRTAIVLLDNDAFCDGGRHIKGPYQLKKRHLEILGFHVITVSQRTWYSMYMSEPTAKAKYLRDSIGCEVKESAL